MTTYDTITLGLYWDLDLISDFCNNLCYLYGKSKGFWMCSNANLPVYSSEAIPFELLSTYISFRTAQYLERSLHYLGNSTG
jgi:hypothetical protein